MSAKEEPKTPGHRSWSSLPFGRKAKTKSRSKEKEKKRRTKKRNEFRRRLSFLSFVFFPFLSALLFFDSHKSKKKALLPNIPAVRSTTHQHAMSSLNPKAPIFIPSSSPPATEFDWEVRQRRKQRRNEAMKLRRRRKKSRREGAALLHAIGPLRAARSFI